MAGVVITVGEQDYEFEDGVSLDAAKDILRKKGVLNPLPETVKPTDKPKESFFSHPIDNTKKLIEDYNKSANERAAERHISFAPRSNAIASQEVNRDKGRLHGTPPADPNAPDGTRSPVTKAVAGALDIASYPQRVLAATSGRAVDALTGEENPESITKSIGRIKGNNIVGDIVRNPATAAFAIPGIGPTIAGAIDAADLKVQHPDATPVEMLGTAAFDQVAPVLGGRLLKTIPINKLFNDRALSTINVGKLVDNLKDVGAKGFDLSKKVINRDLVGSVNPGNGKVIQFVTSNPSKELSIVETHVKDLENYLINNPSVKNFEEESAKLLKLKQLRDGLTDMVFNKDAPGAFKQTLKNVGQVTGLLGDKGLVAATDALGEVATLSLKGIIKTKRAIPSKMRDIIKMAGMGLPQETNPLRN